MSTSDTDIKLLWGLAAGKCSHPECGTDCVQFLRSDDPILIGEMAHVIARKPRGPRANGKGGDDTYGNLILLCPTHHTLVDKAPARYPTELLHGWKTQHETNVRRALEAPRFSDKIALSQHVLRLLIESHAIWKTYGPDSQVAQTNPLSNASGIWTLRKLGTIIPNNRQIVNLLRQHRNFFTTEEYAICCEFIEHAEGFEQSAYERREGVPKFPQRFEEVMGNAAQ